MIALDTVFLIVELGFGYWVGSLALVADAFHMVRSLLPFAPRLLSAALDD